MAPVPPFWDICQWQNFPGNLNTWPNTSSKRFFLLPFLQPKKKCPKIYAVTLVLPLKKIWKITTYWKQVISDMQYLMVSKIVILISHRGVLVLGTLWKTFRRQSKVNVPMTRHLRMLYQYRDIHTKSYFRLSLAHGLSRNRDMSRHWYVYLSLNTLTTLLCHFPLLPGQPLCNEHYEHDLESVNSDETGSASFLLPN